jgi:hypothetical protein
MRGNDMRPEPSELKRLRLRYAGICVVCGAPLPQGTQAMYHSATKTVRCSACLGPELTGQPTIVDASYAVPPVAQPFGRPFAQPDFIGPAPVDVGTPGSSAQREYERRVAKREARAKERFGRRLGGFLVAVTDEPQSTRAWAKGARGERKLAEALEGATDTIVLSDRRVPGTRGNIDHLLIAPAGVFVVDAKRYKGSLRIRDVGGFFRTDNRLYVGGRDCSHLADNMGWQVQAVETLLASVEVAMPVTPVLCFIDAEWPLLFPPDSFRGVLLEDPRSLRKRIAATQSLDAVAMDQLARILAIGFLPK